MSLLSSLLPKKSGKCDFNTKATVPRLHNVGARTSSYGQWTGGGVCAKITKSKPEVRRGVL